MDVKLPDKNIKEFHENIVALIKKYQFRDRNEITCFGISVSQCYVLETLYSFRNLTMKELAIKMHLSISTITRIADQLEMKELIIREQNADDQRVRNLKLTDKGKEVYLKSWRAVFESEKKIFENIKPEYREMIIELLKELNRSADIWQGSCKIQK